MNTVNPAAAIQAVTGTKHGGRRCSSLPDLDRSREQSEDFVKACHLIHELFQVLHDAFDAVRIPALLSNVSLMQNLGLECQMHQR